MKKSGVMFVVNLALLTVVQISSGVCYWDAPSYAAPGDPVRVALVTDQSGVGGFGDFKLNVSGGSYIEGSAGTTQTVFNIIPFGVTVTPVAEGFDMRVFGNNLLPTTPGELFYFEFILTERWPTISYISGSINSQQVDIPQWPSLPPQGFANINNGPFTIGPHETITLDGSGSNGSYYDWFIDGNQVGSGITTQVSYDYLVNTFGLTNGIYEVRLDVYGDWDYSTIEIVPEPMSICLLGIGGLLLRRRR